MKRFAITVLVATVLHAVACILVPPFEFAPTRPACFFYAFTSGLMTFPFIFALLLLPLRAALRRLMPDRWPHIYSTGLSSGAYAGSLSMVIRPPVEAM